MSDNNRMSLNFKKTCKMVVSGNSRESLSDEIPNIGRKVELQLLGVVFSEDPSNWKKTV